VMDRPSGIVTINVLVWSVEATGAAELGAVQFPVALESRRFESGKRPYGVK